MGWKAASAPNTDLVLDALEQAICDRKRPRPAKSEPRFRLVIAISLSQVLRRPIESALYAWVAVPAALFSAVALSRVPRRPLLVALMLILALSSGVAAMAETFPALMGARMIGALSQ